VTTLAKQFAVVFFIGFVAVVAALGLGGMAGSLFSSNVYLYAIRTAGLAFMLGGLALWIAKRRDEGGKPALTPLIAMIVVLGLAAAVIGLIDPQSIAGYLEPAAVGATATALGIGTIAMLISPAGAKPLTVSWPEGGAGDPYAPAVEHHAEPAHDEAAQTHAH
jgi:hypothetical protein